MDRATYGTMGLDNNNIALRRIRKKGGCYTVAGITVAGIPWPYYPITGLK